MDDSLCLCQLLKALAATCERELNNALAELQSSHCQANVLLKIFEGGTRTMYAVSKQLCCHKSNVTQVVDGLVAKGLIERKNSDVDRRVCSLVLTKKGVAISAKAHVLLRHRAEKCIDSLSTKDRAVLAKILRQALAGE